MTHEKASAALGAPTSEDGAAGPDPGGGVARRSRTRREHRVTLIGRPMTPEAWADIVRECLEALAGD